LVVKELSREMQERGLGTTARKVGRDVRQEPWTDSVMVKEELLLLILKGGEGRQGGIRGRCVQKEPRHHGEHSRDKKLSETIESHLRTSNTGLDVERMARPRVRLEGGRVGDAPWSCLQRNGLPRMSSAKVSKVGLVADEDKRSLRNFLRIV
jgi:hypothetical protein